MGINKDLLKYTAIESFNADYAQGWTTTRGQSNNNTGEEGQLLSEEFTLNTTHSILKIYCERRCRIGFYDKSGETNGNNSLRVEEAKVHEFPIPSGATHFVVRGDYSEDANRYFYITTG